MANLILTMLISKLTVSCFVQGDYTAEAVRLVKKVRLKYMLFLRDTLTIAMQLGYTERIEGHACAVLTTDEKAGEQCSHQNTRLQDKDALSEEEGHYNKSEFTRKTQPVFLQLSELPSTCGRNSQNCIFTEDYIIDGGNGKKTRI